MGGLGHDQEGKQTLRAMTVFLQTYLKKLMWGQRRDKVTQKEIRGGYPEVDAHMDFTLLPYKSINPVIGKVFPLNLFAHVSLPILLSCCPEIAYSFNNTSHFF